MLLLATYLSRRVGSSVVSSTLDGVIDLGVVYLPPQNPEIEAIPVHLESFHLIASRHFPMETKELTALELAALPLVFLDWGASFSSWFRKEMGSSYLPGEVDHAHLLMQFIIQGKGLGLVLHSVARRDLQLEIW